MYNAPVTTLMHVVLHLTLPSSLLCRVTLALKEREDLMVPTVFLVCLVNLAKRYNDSNMYLSLILLLHHVVLK